MLTKLMRMIAKLILVILPIIFYLILLKIIPDIRGNLPRADEIKSIRLFLPCILYIIEYLIVFLVYIVKAIMAFEDNNSLKWFNIANAGKFLLLLIADIWMLQFMFMNVTTQKVGENLLYGYAIIAGIIEILFILWQKRLHKCCNRR